MTAAAVLSAFVGCEPKAGPAPAPSASAARATGRACPEGVSVDPPPSELRPGILAFRAKDYRAARQLQGALVKRYPASATVLVWLGEVELYDDAAGADDAARRALVHFDAAQALRDEGCALPEYEDYYLRFDRALAFLRLKDAAKARAELAVSKKKWNMSAEVFYNSARAECLAKDVDACLIDFRECLVIAKSLRRPHFLRNHNSIEDFVRRSRTQSEFLGLRRDPRYQQTVRALTVE